MTLFIDIETYSPVDLRKANVYRYSEHPDFRILMAAYAADDGPVEVVTDTADIQRIPGLLNPDVVKVAHNAAFERVCFSSLFGLVQESHTYLPPEHWFDTMAVAAELGYPQNLGQLARALGGEQKDEAGTRLINLFSKPNCKRTRNLPSDYPEDWEDFVEYCRQDVETLRSAYHGLGSGEWPTEHERLVYVSDQRINDHGVLIDKDMVSAAIEAADDNRMVQELEISALTGVVNPSSGPQMLKWLRGEGGLPLPDLKKETVEKALTRSLPEDTRRVLELRQDLALVASRKYTAAWESVCGDGRLRGQFRFFGAHTGRWAGVGVQLHNLPRAQMESDVEAEAAILDLKMGNGADADTLKRLVRGMLVGPFTVVDYSAIEARVVAWLAGEEWALEAFRAGRDIYVETAQRMGGLTRFQGKVAVLALGYNGGVNSLRAMGYGGDKAAALDRVRCGGDRKEHLTDEEIQPLVGAWRGTNPNIVSMWKEMDVAFRRGGEVGSGLITVEVHGGDRAIRLPSGRASWYRNCKWERKRNRFGNMSVQTTFTDPKMPRFRADTYGGRLIENVTQAVARDVLAASLVRLQYAGLTPVGHVHDEILVEGEHDVDYIRSLMIKDPGWAAGLPLNGEGFTCARYRKG